MYGLSTADEANGGHAVAPAVESFAGGLHDSRVIGQSEVIICAKIDDVAGVGQSDIGVLGRIDGAFGLEQSLGADGLQFGEGVIGETGHGEIS